MLCSTLSIVSSCSPYSLALYKHHPAPPLQPPHLSPLFFSIGRFSFALFSLFPEQNEFPSQKTFLSPFWFIPKAVFFFFHLSVFLFLLSLSLFLWTHATVNVCLRREQVRCLDEVRGSNLILDTSVVMDDSLIKPIHVSSFTLSVRSLDTGHLSA